MITAREYLLNKLVKEASYHAAEACSSYNAAIALAGGMEKNASVLGALGAVGSFLAAHPGLISIPLGLSLTGLGINNAIKNRQNIINQAANQQKLLNAQLDYINESKKAIGKTPVGTNPWLIGGAAALGASIPVVAGKIHDYFSNRKKERQYE